MAVKSFSLFRVGSSIGSYRSPNITIYSQETLFGTDLSSIELNVAKLEQTGAEDICTSPAFMVHDRAVSPEGLPYLTSYWLLGFDDHVKHTLWDSSAIKERGEFLIDPIHNRCVTEAEHQLSISPA